jgi:alkanesulfonate monooxygenase SsuD/methylene tetrahydromethanopterin reductase-like flavin-dependent oxidoreductase (luciferase family)
VDEGHPVRIAWARRTPRVWIAGYGPQALTLAGRIADGVILQFADPALISCIAPVPRAALRSSEIQAAAAANYFKLGKVPACLASTLAHESQTPGFRRWSPTMSWI